MGRDSEASEVPESPSSATRSLSNYESGRSGGGEVDAAVQLEAAVSSSVRGPGQGRASSGLVGALSRVCHPAAHKRGVYLFSWPGSIQAYAANPTLAASNATLHPLCSRCVECLVQDHLAQLLRRQLASR